MVAMTDLLELKPDDVLLEIGTGLGYQAAVLAELAGRVYSVKIIDELARRAIQRLKRQGYTNVEVRVGNGYAGWPKHAPFDNCWVHSSSRNQSRCGSLLALVLFFCGILFVAG
jgi:protein-L-isoaspartate(D-aspartate) O-methyltransferase